MLHKKKKPVFGYNQLNFELLFMQSKTKRRPSGVNFLCLVTSVSCVPTHAPRNFFDLRAKKSAAHVTPTAAFCFVEQAWACLAFITPAAACNTAAAAAAHAACEAR